MLTIKEISSRSDLKKFVQFPFQLYKDNPYWVPPIISEELASFDQGKNPAFQTADAWWFLAYRNGEIVGRITVMINWTEVKEQKIAKLRFGWFDFIDDMEVSKILLDKAYQIGKAHKLEFAEGPIGFSNMDKVGVLTEGFDHIGSMITWYNHDYYVNHYIAHGLLPEKKYLEQKFNFSAVEPTKFKKISSIVQGRYKLTPKSFKQTKDILPYVDEMFDLFNASYSKLSSHVAINDAQKAYFKKKYISFINPEYIHFVLDENGKIISFAIVMPSFSEALQQIKGKLFPFGFLKLLKAKKHSKTVLFYLIGIQPEYQSKGVTAIIFSHYYDVFKEKGIKNCIRTPELEDNHAIQSLWTEFKPVVFKKRSTFKIDL
ncbi:MAG: GNAT family N-acetyltransferase [Flavobacteriaceae bacterium]|nr:GNAT family N-acetyltransferase [Flavobacteriaceae bacterium]